MSSRQEKIEQRVLVLAPIGRDAKAAAQLLSGNGIRCMVCSNVQELRTEVEHGAAAALVAEEAFLQDSSQALEQWVSGQPPWSDFPFIMLTSSRTSASAHAYRVRLLEGLGNVSLLERPLNPVTLVSTLRAALRARHRQYEVRGHLLEREITAAQLEDVVRERTSQLEETNRKLRQEISERQQAEAALQQAHKMELIGQMTGGIAHDFNNLLTAVIGNLELALRRGRDETIKRFLDGATQAAQRGAKITSQLLAFSRSQRLQTESTDLNSLIRGMGDLLFRSIGATVRVETLLQKDLWPAAVDPTQIELVVLNLAVNARDAMPSGGRLTISTANVAQDCLDKPTDLSGDYVAISVADNGTGMTEEVLKKAYEPFFTTKPVGSGTGLGLSQVYGVVKQSGGSVAIDTKLGSGTTVTLYLPRAREQPSLHSGDRSTDTPLPRHDATILVVDDDHDVRQLVVSCLESLGYRVRSAADGRSALDMIVGNAPVDLLLIDVAMPEINGVETVQAILRKRPNLPFLYMTGYTGPAHLDDGERRLLKKPFTLAELSSKVEEILFPSEVRRLPSNVFPIKPDNLAS